MKNLYLILLLFSTATFSQIINFTDPFFKIQLLQEGVRDASGNYFDVDINDDGEIDVTEAQAVYGITISPSPYLQTVTSLEGIQYFTELRRLAATNQNMTGNVDVSMLPHLKNLFLGGNALTSVNVTGLSELEGLYIGTNPPLASLDLNGCNSLKTLSIGPSAISDIDLSEIVGLEYFIASGITIPYLDFSGLANLKSIDANNCGLQSINLSGTSNLNWLYLQNNQLTQLDISDSPITILQISNNLLTSLDLSHQTVPISSLNASNNQLVWISFKNGFGDIGNNTDFSMNPMLQFACCDSFETGQLNSKITTYGYYSSCIQTTYCTPYPGGTVYRINGRFKLAVDGNCSDSSPGAAYVKYAGTTAADSFIMYANSLGNYSTPFLAGYAAVTPMVNSTLFTTSPTVAEANFPTTASPYLQDFCLVPNGSHPNVQVDLLPISVARPGFVAKYKLVLHNSGNTSESGSVTFAFDDAKLDLIWANPAPTFTASGSTAWDFVNLLPFETREIELDVDVNSPMATPPVNQGDILHYTATITIPSLDEFLPDNTSQLDQIVVAALDPNDKTCSEGAVAGSEVIGSYVNYVIRFENSGNYPATNVVIVDEINANQFDISSLQPLSGSHPFFTRISENKVEFIFENIDLPFESGSNQGYVAFRIKTKESLHVGDYFSNSAKIYFDYNYPINTGSAYTEITALGLEQSNEAISLNFWPNPVRETLNFEILDAGEVQSVEIYNVAGQQLITLLHPSGSTLDLDRLESGTYFFKIKTAKGNAVRKFIKQ